MFEKFLKKFKKNVDMYVKTCYYYSVNKNMNPI